VIGTLGRAANSLNILINWFGDKNDGKRLIPAVLCPVGVKDVTVPADPSGGLHRFDPIVGRSQPLCAQDPLRLRHPRRTRLGRQTSPTSRSSINTVIENVCGLDDDVAEGSANAEDDALVFLYLRVVGGNFSLHLFGARNDINDGGEL
jgi:hypothetical protein